MDESSFYFRVDEIIGLSIELVRSVYQGPLVIDYLAVFARDNDDYKALSSFLASKGRVVERTITGNTVLLDSPYKTPFGSLRLIKVRKPDVSKAGFKGAPDFKVDYVEFKKRFSKFCNLIKRKDYEMLELVGDEVMVYFPSETLSESLKLTKPKK